MTSTASFDELTWHDGRILDIHIGFDPSGACEIKLKVSLLESLSTQDRIHYLIVATNPERFFSNMDIYLMVQHFKFGNIADAKLYHNESKKLLIYLGEGYLEIIGHNIEISGKMGTPYN